MASFKDSAGRNYDLRVTVASARRVKDRCGVDLLKCLDAEAKVLESLAEDPMKVFDVILAILDESESVGEDWDEETLSAAGAALMEAILDFFPQWKAAPLRRMLRKNQPALDRMTRQAETALNEAAEQYDAESVLQNYLTSKSSVGDSQGKSGSIQAPALSASSS